MIRLQNIFDIPPEYARARFAILFDGEKDLYNKEQFLLRPYKEALKHVNWKLTNWGKWKGDDFFILDDSKGFADMIGYAQWFENMWAEKDPIIELGIFISKDRRNEGLGSWAIKELETLLDPIEVYLTMFPLKKNTKAIALYRRLGYKIKKSPLADGRDFLYLYKEIGT